MSREKIANPCRVNGCPNSASSTGIICGTCSREGLAQLRRLPVLHAALRAALVPSSSASSGDKLARAKAASRAPVDALAFDTAERVEAFAAWLDDRMRAALEMTARDHSTMRPGAVMSGAVSLAGRSWGRVMLLGTAPELLHRLGRVTRAARVALGLDELVHRLSLPCPACGLVTLTRADGGDVVRCASCGSSWHEREYRHLVRVLVDELGASGAADSS